MIGLIFLIVLGGYFLLSIWVINVAVKQARKRCKPGWYYGVPAGEERKGPMRQVLGCSVSYRVAIDLQQFRGLWLLSPGRKLSFQFLFHGCYRH
jgi:hypothetical protein